MFLSNDSFKFHVWTVIPLKARLLRDYLHVSCCFFASCFNLFQYFIILHLWTFLQAVFCCQVTSTLYCGFMVLFDLKLVA